MPAPLKILHVGESVKGGAGTHLNELVPLQMAQLKDSHIIVLVPGEHRIQLPRINPGNIRTFKRPGRLRGLPALTFALIRNLKSMRPDILHAHSTFAGAIARVLGVVFRVPVVYTPHGWVMDVTESAHKRRIIGWAERGLSVFCRRIIAVSEHERRRGIEFGIPAAKLVTVHNGINPEPPPVRPAAWEDARLRILFVGRLDRQKGIDVLLKAITGLEDKVTLRIVGDSVVGDKRIDRSGFPQVSLLGWLSHEEVAAQMMASDVLVVPSRWEGFGLVALEAMRLFKPVIAAAVGGLPEIVIDGVTGYLFPPEDAAALNAILSRVDRKELAQLGEAGHARFLEQFAAAKMCDAVTRVYAECGGAH